MRLWFLLLLPVRGLDAVSTVTKTDVVPHTGVFSTHNGVVLFNIPYTQYFTAYFQSIAEPLSGSIGMGNIVGQIGQSREYPLELTTSRNISAIPAKPSLLRQQLNTNSLGQVFSPTWASTVAQAGGKTYSGTTYIQNSIDLTILPSPCTTTTTATSADNFATSST